MKTSQIKNNHKYPAFVRQHEIFSKFKDVRKVFPSIGLRNCSITISNIRVTKDLAQIVRKSLMNLCDDLRYAHYGCISSHDIYHQILKSAPNDFILNGKIHLTPPSLSQFLSKNKKFNSFEKIYKKLYYEEFYCLPEMDRQILPFLPNDKIVFSSNGTQGLWDIVTMSERGIDSCQSWTGSYRANLTGSIIDPCVGIIYITNNKNYGNKGSKMISRALVRYVVNISSKKKALLLEQIYCDESVEQESKIYFTEFLKQKTGNRFPIIHSSRGYSIPNSKIVQAMSTCDDGGEYNKDHCRSYRDSGIGYSKKQFKL